ncbi:DUF3850 domain-containing protein [Patescibacteria group bacterium]
MSKRIEKKVWPEYFQAILVGDKKFELRLADWKCNKGDILVLKEWNPDTKKYTGRVLEKEVKYVIKTKEAEKFFSKKDIEKFGFQIISFD